MESCVVNLTQRGETEEECQNLGTGVQNLHVSAHVKEDSSSGTTVSMLYAVSPGACERSYGIHVARAARFPQEIIDNASALESQMLRALDQGGELISPHNSPLLIQFFLEGQQSRQSVREKESIDEVVRESIDEVGRKRKREVRSGYVDKLKELLALGVVVESNIQQQMRSTLEHFLKDY